MSSEPNRRRDYRAQTSGTVRLALGNPPGTSIDADCKDISSSGLRAVVHQALEPDTHVDVSVPLQDGESLTAPGRVVRCSPSTDAEGSYEVAIVLTHKNPLLENVLRAHIFGMEMKRMRDAK